MHIPRGRRHFFEKTLFCFDLYYACFLVVLWCFELCLVSSMLCCSHRIIFLCPIRILFLDAYTSCILHWSSVGHAFVLMLLCFIDCMFEWSFALLYDHCGHFHMSCVWSSCSYVSYHVYLIAFYLLHYTCHFITCFTLRV